MTDSINISITVRLNAEQSSKHDAAIKTLWKATETNGIDLCISNGNRIEETRQGPVVVFGDGVFVNAKTVSPGGAVEIAKFIEAVCKE